MSVSDYIYDGAVERIQGVYQSCSPAEQSQLRNILEEMADKGYSETLENIWLTDFKEIPVGIDQFICDPHYMGGVNRNGDAIYPFWRNMFRDIFNHGNQYNEIILSGSTRIGKTSSSIVIATYMLYRLMLYRNPHEYFKKKEVSRFTIAFANLTKELAMSVAYREYNDTLRDCPWFMERGRISASDRNFYYVPEGDKIEIIPISDGSQALGKQLWCVVGSTKIVTSEGIQKIEDLAGREVTVLQWDGTDYVESEAEVQLTRYTQETIRIELEDGSTIEGTSDHRVMLADGSYKRLDGLISSHNLFALDTSRQNLTGLSMKIKSIERIYHDDPIPVYDVIDAKPNHNFIIASNSLLVSHNCCVIDEANFAKSGTKDIEKAKQHMKRLYDTANARISGTFRIGGEVYGKLVVASSKNQDNDYLSDHIEKQLSAGNKSLYLVDEPQWNVLPASMFSDKKFHFTVGDRYKKGFVIPEEDDDEEHRAAYEAMGFQVIEAPAELRKNFLADYDISLRDIAGISVAGAMGFITQEMITPCISETRKNPFFVDTLTIDANSDLEIADFFHDEVVPNDLKYQQMNIHLDLAESHNHTGIAGACVCGTKLIETEEGKKVAMPIVKEVFSVGIKASQGAKMSFQKVINFMIWLRQHHYNVGTISTDQYQSDFLRETLQMKGFTTAKISVTRSMEPFIGMKNLLIDQRIELIKNQTREDELISFKRLGNTIFAEETEDGRHADIAEAVVGACWTLTTDKVASKPPAKSLARITAAVNGGRGSVRPTPAGGRSPILLGSGTNTRPRFPIR